MMISRWRAEGFGNVQGDILSGLVAVRDRAVLEFRREGVEVTLTEMHDTSTAIADRLAVHGKVAGAASFPATRGFAS
jgi:hypothetical protein